MWTRDYFRVSEMTAWPKQVVLGGDIKKTVDFLNGQISLVIRLSKSRQSKWVSTPVIRCKLEYQHSAAMTAKYARIGLGVHFKCKPHDDKFVEWYGQDSQQEQHEYEQNTHIVLTESTENTLQCVVCRVHVWCHLMEEDKVPPMPSAQTTKEAAIDAEVAKLSSAEKAEWSQYMKEQRSKHFGMVLDNPRDAARRKLKNQEFAAWLQSARNDVSKLPNRHKRALRVRLSMFSSNYRVPHSVSVAFQELDLDEAEEEHEEAMRKEWPVSIWDIRAKQQMEESDEYDTEPPRFFGSAVAAQHWRDRHRKKKKRNDHENNHNNRK